MIFRHAIIRCSEFENENRFFEDGHDSRVQLSIFIHLYWMSFWLFFFFLFCLFSFHFLNSGFWIRYASEFDWTNLNNVRWHGKSYLGTPQGSQHMINDHVNSLNSFEFLSSKYWKIFNFVLPKCQFITLFLVSISVWDEWIVIWCMPPFHVVFSWFTVYNRKHWMLNGERWTVNGDERDMKWHFMLGWEKRMCDIIYHEQQVICLDISISFLFTVHCR